MLLCNYGMTSNLSRDRHQIMCQTWEICSRDQIAVFTVKQPTISKTEEGDVGHECVQGYASRFFFTFAGQDCTP